MAVIMWSPILDLYCSLLGERLLYKSGKISNSGARDESEE